jgi:superoxide reductase
MNIYKCQICGAVVEVLVPAGEIFCCGQPMDLMEAMTAKNEGKEKHVPVIEIKGNTVKVKIGSIPHPMEEKHHIVMVELIKGGKVVARTEFKAGEKPEAEFCLEDVSGLTARELCNIHGLWQT